MIGLLSIALLAGQLASEDTLHLVVVATTDVHGRAYHWDYAEDREAPWGITRAATAIDSLREAYPGRVLVVDAGDLIQGDAFAAYFAEQRVVVPHPVVEALNTAGFDAATPGNHEFNWGLDLFARAMASAAFPVVSGNLYRLPRDTLAFPPFSVLVRQGARVGVTGFTTPGAMVWDRANLRGRLLVRPILPEARRVLQELAAAGADLRIAVIHSGMDGPSSYDTRGVGEENVAMGLARLPVPPHLVVVGHTHRVMRDSVVNGVHFIQPPPHARGLAVAHVWMVKTNRTDVGRSGGFEVARIQGETISLDEVPPHPVVTARLASAHEAIRVWVNQPIAEVVEGDWSAWYGRAEDTPIIDFLNEVQRMAGGAELSATAAFNPRARFGPGEVQLRDVAALYPYENTLRVIVIDGRTLKAYLEQSAAYFRTYVPGAPIINDSMPGYNFDIVSGVDYVLDLTQPVGSRVRQITYGGRLVQPTDTFTMALNSYRQGGGGGFTMLRDAPVIFDGQDIRDLVVEHLRVVCYLRARDYFTPSWRIVPEAAATAVRDALGPAPVALARVPEPRGRTDTLRPTDPNAHLPYEVQGRFTRPLAEIKVPLIPTGSEHGLGRLVADAYRGAARAHVAVVPNARLTVTLPSGPITEGHIDSVLPVPDELVTLELTGRQLTALFELAVQPGEPTIHVSGVQVVFDPGRRVGRRIREVRFPDGEKVKDNDTYRLAVPATLVSQEGLLIPVGGGASSALDRFAVERTGVRENEALLAHLQALRQPVAPPPTPRFRMRR